MRRHRFLALLTVLAAALCGSALRADDPTSVLGAAGEIYHVETGTYGSLFAHPPAGAANNPVLALDITRSGKLQRVLVPTTDGPDVKRYPALAIDRATNHVFVVWQGQVNIHSVLNLVSYAADAGFGEPLEFSGDAFSTKANPQLATTVDTFQVLGSDGQPVAVTRTILHLVWFDDGGLGRRVLYTPIVIDDGDVLRTNLVFDLRELAGGTPGAPPANSLLPLFESPQIHAGRDGQSVVVGFIDSASDELVTMELRSVTGSLVSFADKARAVTIDTGRNNPGASHAQIADLAQAQVSAIGHTLLRPDIGDFLSHTFLSSLSTSDPASDLLTIVGKARAVTIDTGVSLHRGIADKAIAHVIEIGSSNPDDSGTSHLLDLRNASRRPLPSLPLADLNVYLSDKGDDAAFAWNGGASLLYVESAGSGWSPRQSLALGTGMSLDQALALVAQRQANR